MFINVSPLVHLLCFGLLTTKVYFSFRIQEFISFSDKEVYFSFRQRRVFLFFRQRSVFLIAGYRWTRCGWLYKNPKGPFQGHHMAHSLLCIFDMYFCFLVSGLQSREREQMKTNTQLGPTLSPPLWLLLLHGQYDCCYPNSTITPDLPPSPYIQAYTHSTPTLH